LTLYSLAEGTAKKLFILSVTGTADEVAMAYALIANAAEMDEDLRLAMEVNLSCPNIEGKPPPAYEREGLREYLEAINDSKRTYRGRMDAESVPRVGVKLPPYTHAGQFAMVVQEIQRINKEDVDGRLDFVTSTNTLGGCLVLGEGMEKALNSESGTGTGGMAGQALHPLSLGNVATLRRLLDEHEETREVVVIGVGGVESKDGYERMKAVGAGAVGCATALGREGVGVFAKISGVKEGAKVPKVVVERVRKEITDTYR
jgi:dihydroorotate dehydrogenase (fumarate)